jgi:hypothetical protein
MKIWCIDHALTWNIHSEVYFTKEEAQERYDHYSSIKDAYVKMYQVEDIWGWCGRHFDQVILEILNSRDNGDDAIYIYGMANEIREAADHCGLKQLSIDAFWINDHEFLLSVAWVREGELHHSTRSFDAVDTYYNHPTIVERRSKYQCE